jgi:hypothetical protein
VEDHLALSRSTAGFSVSKIKGQGPTDQAHTPDRRPARHSDAIELSVETDRLWERIVHQVLLRTDFTTVYEQHSQPDGLVVDPWLSPTRNRSTHPDNIALRGNTIWVIDAKYKTIAPGALPSRSDQYQMFAYSHLVASPDQRVHRVMLLYPGHHPPRTWMRGRDDPDSCVQLVAATLPFPGPDDTVTPARWQAYLDRAAAHLQHILPALPVGPQQPSPAQ